MATSCEPLRDLAPQRRGHRLRDLVVAAADVVLLVGLAEQAQLALADVAEQVEQVERALLVALGAELDVVRDVEQLPEARLDAARHALLDPLRDRHRVEHAAARGGDPVGRRERGGRRRPCGASGRRRCSPRPPPRTCTARRRSSRAARCRWPRPGAGCRSRTRAPSTSWRMSMCPVSISSPPCSATRPGRERPADRPAAPAEAVARLVQLGVHAGLLEPVGAGEAGEPAADDDDLLRVAARARGVQAATDTAAAPAAPRNWRRLSARCSHARGERSACHSRDTTERCIVRNGQRWPPARRRQGAVKPRISSDASQRHVELRAVADAVELDPVGVREHRALALGGARPREDAVGGAPHDPHRARHALGVQRPAARRAWSFIARMPVQPRDAAHLVGEQLGRDVLPALGHQLRGAAAALAAWRRAPRRAARAATSSSCIVSK